MISFDMRWGPQTLQHMQEVQRGFTLHLVVIECYLLWRKADMSSLVQGLGLIIVPTTLTLTPKNYLALNSCMQRKDKRDIFGVMTRQK